MIKITNDKEFRQALSGLDKVQQRVVAARFTENVLSLCDDKRIARIVKTAADADASEDELKIAHNTAKAAVFDCHTRCGSEGNWTEQAGYFVARAAAAAVSPDHLMAGGPAWQAAVSSRMARTCERIDIAQDSGCSAEQEQQYRILSEFLAAKPNTP